MPEEIENHFLKKLRLQLFVTIPNPFQDPLYYHKENIKQPSPLRTMLILLWVSTFTFLDRPLSDLDRC